MHKTGHILLTCCSFLCRLTHVAVLLRKKLVTQNLTKFARDAMRLKIAFYCLKTKILLKKEYYILSKFKGEYTKLFRRTVLYFCKNNCQQTLSPVTIYKCMSWRFSGTKYRNWCILDSVDENKKTLLPWWWDGKEFSVYRYLWSWWI